MRRLLLAVALVAAAAPLPLARAGGGVAPAAWSPRPATYGVVVERDVAVTMSDGARLFADVYRPADGAVPAPGRFPVVLTQTPYNKQGGGGFRYLVERGYVHVVADVRGTGSSEGLWDFFSTREQLDGAELVAWAASAERPWSAGAVGLYGASYLGMNQFFTAAQQPPGLKAIFPMVAPGDIFRSAAMPGGQLSTIASIQGLIGLLGMLPPGYTASDPLLAAGTRANRPLALAQSGLGTADIIAGGDRGFDGPYYWARSGLRMVDRIEVPTFLAGGWFDIAQRDLPYLFEELRDRGVPVKLLMGPWYHNDVGSGLPRDGLPAFEALVLRWFDRWVAGIPDAELDALGPVIYERLGEGRLHTASDWPPPGGHHEAVHLAGPATPGSPGRLDPAPASAGGADAVAWQPGAGACSGSTRYALLGLVPPSPCDDDGRANDLTGVAYDLPLASELRLAGPMAARLFVSTTAADAFVTLRLEDVAPDGTATPLTAGWDTLSLRALDPDRTRTSGGHVVRPFHPYTRESVLPVVAGEVYEWWVEIWPVAASLPAGHRLRLAVQPSDAVRSVPKVPAAAAQAGGVLRVHHGPEHPSAVVLAVAG